MRHEPSDVVYRLDKDDLLVFFNDQWDSFAEDNGSPDLIGKNIDKRPIWDFIHDAETRHLHETLLKKARSGKRGLNVPFRCDAPGLRRFMDMDISLLDDGKIEYRCRTIRTEVREPVPLTPGNLKAGQSFLRMCSWCKKIDAGNDYWLEIEEAIKVLGLFSEARMPEISHTMCHACLAELETDD
ncbi:MAG: hypothetical protein WC073_05790 [Sterolibacterium sp.]